MDGCPHEAERAANDQSFGVKTRLDYRYKLENYILPDPIAKKRLCDITRPDSLDFRDRIIGKLGFTRKAQLTLIAYRNIINTALNRGLIHIDPMVKVAIKLKKKGTRAATNIDSVKNILLKKNWPNRTIWMAAITAAVAGLRAGEICGLLWQDIDLDRGFIEVCRSYNLYEGEKSTKSGKSRFVPYPKVLQAVLEPHRGAPSSYVFSIRDNGDPLCYSSLKSAMARAVERAGTTKISLHGLRHSINTALLDAGVNPELLRATFGWVDEETQEIYTHRELFKLSPQMEAMDDLFKDFTGEETHAGTA
jgi:integrase